MFKNWLQLISILFVMFFSFGQVHAALNLLGEFDTERSILPNDGVSYSTSPARDDIAWKWEDTPSIAETTGLYFNGPMPWLNPFQPFSMEQGITSNPSDDLLPQVVRFGKQLTVVWQRDDEIYIQTSVDNGTSWQSEIRVANGENPALVVDIQGIWHLVFSNNGTIYYVHLDHDGHIVGVPVELGTGCWPDVAVDRAGDPFVVWKQVCTGGGFTEIVLVRSANGGQTFSTKTPVGEITLGWSDPPKVAVSSSGNHVYVIWKAPPVYGAYVRTYFARSLNGGESFEETFNPTGFTHHGEYSPVIIALREDEVSISWVLDRSHQLYTNFARSTDAGATFSPRLQVGSIEDNAEPAIAIDQYDNICLTWRRNNDVFAACSNDKGQTFQKPLPIVSSPADTMQRNPSISLWCDGNTIYSDLVWEDNRNDNFDIFFISKPIMLRPEGCYERFLPLLIAP